MKTIASLFEGNILYYSYIAFCLFILGVAGYDLKSDYFQQKEKALLTIENEAKQMDRILVSRVATLDVALKILKYRFSKNPSLIRGFAQNELIAIRNSLPFHENLELRVADREGNITLRTDDKKLFNIRDINLFTYLRDHNTKGIYITEPFQGKTPGGHLIALAHRIVKEDGSFLGIAYATVNIYYFENAFKFDNTFRDSTVLVASGNPLIIAFSSDDAEYSEGHILKEKPVYDSFANSGETPAPIFYYDKNKEAVFSYASYVGDYPIFYGITYNPSGTFSNWQRTACIQLSTLAIILLVGWIALYFFRKMQSKITNHRTHLANNSRFVALGEMAAGISHEINNPLALIQIKTEQLMEEFVENKAKINQEYCLSLLGSIHNTTIRISKIVIGLKAFSRNSTNDSWKIVSLKQIIDDTLAICSERFRTEAIDWVVLGDVEHLQVCGNQIQLGQVLLNLLNNARDATQGLSQRKIQIEANDLGSVIELSVADSGPGIPRHVREKLFQPFFTTKELGAGTGIGLSISQGIVKTHKGEIFLDAKSQQTRFVIQLPKAVALATNFAA